MEKYLYHSADNNDVHSILTQGIQPSENTHREEIEQDLRTIAETNNITPVISRQNCVFLYLSLAQSVRFTDFASSENSNCLAGRAQSLIIVDSAKIDGALYVGEFDLISDAIDFQYMDEPDDTMVSESYNDALKKYALSLTPLSSFSGTVLIHKQYRTPEIVVQNGVSPQAIVDWVG